MHRRVSHHNRTFLPALILACVFMTSLAAAPAHAQDAVDIAAFGTHLEFMGYKVTTTDGRILAQHETKLNVSVKSYRGGALVVSFLKGNDNGRSDRAGFLAFVNKLNAAASAARFYIDDDGDLVLEAWFPGTYDRAHFSKFLESWDVDSGQLLIRNLDEGQKFLQ